MRHFTTKIIALGMAGALMAGGLAGCCYGPRD